MRGHRTEDNAEQSRHRCARTQRGNGPEPAFPAKRRRAACRGACGVRPHQHADREKALYHGEYGGTALDSSVPKTGSSRPCRAADRDLTSQAAVPRAAQAAKIISPERSLVSATGSGCCLPGLFCQLSPHGPAVDDLLARDVLNDADRSLEVLVSAIVRQLYLLVV